MTFLLIFAWYGHLKILGQRAWYMAALFCWRISLFQSLILVPANRVGCSTLSLGQLKVLQKVISPVVFDSFSLFYVQQPLKMDSL